MKKPKSGSRKSHKKGKSYARPAAVPGNFTARTEQDQGKFGTGAAKPQGGSAVGTAQAQDKSESGPAKDHGHSAPGQTALPAGSGAGQAPAPPSKWRPVFGQPLPRGFVPPDNAANQADAAKPAAGKSSGGKPDTSGRTSPAKPVKKGVSPAVLPVKLDLAALPQYFAKMDPMERLLFAYVSYKRPKGWYPETFYSYDPDSLRYLDVDLPGPSYPEIAKVLTKWTKTGILSPEKGSGPLTLADGAAPAFWQWLEQKEAPFFVDIEPQQIYAADLPGTLDTILNLVLWMDRDQILITQNNEINKLSFKKVMAVMPEPVRYPDLFEEGSYLIWLINVIQYMGLAHPKKGFMAVTAAGRELPKLANAAELLNKIASAILRAIKQKGFFLVLPLFASCTKWTSWGKLVEDLIAPAGDAGNLLRKDRVISLLDPWRFLGLLDWGTYEKDILFRVTPLGQKAFPLLLKGAGLNRRLEEIKPHVEEVYPLSGPDTAYVQPNFEIMVPRSASWEVRWQLGKFALLEQQDQMLKYRLDKTYLMDALKRGFPGEEALTVLARLSPYPLPENLVLTVRQWIESFGQVTFMHLVLLECASAEQAATIAGARKYRDYVFGLFNPTTVIVRDPEKLRKLMEKQGIYPLPGVLNGLEVAERKGFTLTNSGETDKGRDDNANPQGQ